jgi:VWFA-related protein
MIENCMACKWSILTAVLLACAGLCAQQEPTYTIRANSDLVQISVVARDRKGGFVRGLTKDDFALMEDGRPQQLSAVDLETVDVVHDPGTPQPMWRLPIFSSSAPVPADAARGLRLVVLFFDFTSLHLPDAARSLRAAEAYVRNIGSSDRVAVVTLAPKLEVQQDFTGDEAELQRALKRLRGLNQTVLETDYPSYELFNAYGRLRSLRLLSNTLAKMPPKKSVVIFAGDVPFGPDLTAIKATTDAAVRARVSFYGVDATGLTAGPPLGDATVASSFSTSVLSGTAVAQNNAAIHDQNLLYRLARGTAGHAFFNSNDFERPFRTMEKDTSEYYILSYRSSNLRRDGEYRRISLRARQRGLELNYPPGYYGPNDRTRPDGRDIERVLSDELAADLPDTSLPVLGLLNYLQTAADLFYVPITVLLPAEALLDNGEVSSAALGLTVTDDRGRVVRTLRDFIPANLVRQHPSGAVQYETATELPAGQYKLRVAVVQTSTGEIGSFTTSFRLPSPTQSRMSVSQLLSGTLVPAIKFNGPKSPLVVNGSRLILNPLAEYGDNRRLAIQYQVECRTGMHGVSSCDASQVRSSLQCFLSDQRIFRAEPLAATVTAYAAVFRVELPSGSLHPGTYKCRVTAINSQCGAFAFGATELRIRDELARPASLVGDSGP